MPRAPVELAVNAREVERSLKAFDKDLQKRTRRMMADTARQARDEVRAAWPTGPAGGGHSKAAVTSGTKGLRPVLKLNRDWKPRGSRAGWKSPVGWLVFGGVRRRHGRPWDKTPRPRLADGRWFYPGVKRARARVVRDVHKILADSIRQAGLD